MQHHPLVAGEERGVAHQLPAHRKGRAGRHADPQHRAFRGVVEGVDHPDRVVEDGGLRLHQRVGRQPARALADAHRAPGRVESQPHLARRLDGVVEPGAIRVEVEVIGRGRAARQRQFGEPDHGRDPHLLGTEPRPDRVERLEPAEQQRVLPSRHRAGQGLVEVVMGVDETRGDETAGGVDHFAGRFQPGADRGDDPVAQEDVGARELRPRVVHRQHDLRAPDQYLAHRPCPLRMRTFTNAAAAGRRAAPHCRRRPRVPPRVASASQPAL